MSEREFRRWQRYRAQKLYPYERSEPYLAQIACWVARGAGAENVSIDDFMIERVAKEGSDDQLAMASPVDQLAAAKEFFNFKPQG